MGRLKEIQIFIHTYGRANWQKTLEFISPNIQKRTWLVVQKREAHLYNWPRLMVLPKKIRGLSLTRQYILENAKKNKIVMLDDDLRFQRRISKDDWHLRNSMPEDMGAMFRKMSRMLDDYAHAGISARLGNNRHAELHLTNVRMNGVIGYNRERVLGVDARFDRIELRQDFDITLQLLRAGLPNLVSVEFAWDQARASNSAGGCSGYRTQEMMTRCAHELAELHPGFVTITEKKTKVYSGAASKTAWKGFGGVRTDVIVYWKKAYDSSQKGK